MFYTHSHVNNHHKHSYNFRQVFFFLPSSLKAQVSLNHFLASCPSLKVKTKLHLLPQSELWINEAMSANALSKLGRNTVRMTSFWRRKFQPSHNTAGLKGRWSHLWVDLEDSFVESSANGS